MALNDYETFRGVNDIRRDNFNQNLLFSFIDWLKWSTLQIGGFQNIAYSYASGIYGGNFSQLRLATDPNYTDGQVWEGFRSDWVWETGITYDVEPIVCSGVYVDGAFYPTASTTGDYAHYVNYPQGRIVFSSAISTSSQVYADFSHRTISYVSADEPWFREVLFDSYRIDESDYLSQGSGAWDQLAVTRRMLPVVGIELGPRRATPYEIGGSAHYTFQDLIIYVLAQYPEERNQIADILSQQYDKTIWIYSRGLLKDAGKYPPDLNYYGYPVDDPLQFPQLVAPTGDGGYQYRKVCLGDFRIQLMDRVSDSLYRGVLKTTVEAIV